MSADMPAPPSRDTALHAAGQAVRDACGTDRDAILEAQRVLRHAEKAHDHAVRAAAKRLREETKHPDAAEKAFAAAHAERQGVESARPLLDRVVGRLQADEEVLDMVAGISAGHDGVMVVTSRRVLFVAPRRTLDLPLDEIDSVKVRGRHFGTRATFVARGVTSVISGLSAIRAAELHDLLQERIASPSLR